MSSSYSLASQALQELTVIWVDTECTMPNIARHWKVLAIAKQHSSKEPQGTLCARNGSTKKDHSEHATQVERKYI